MYKVYPVTVPARPWVGDEAGHATAIEVLVCSITVTYIGAFSKSATGTSMTGLLSEGPIRFIAW
jgi:hypothetical protein